MHVKLAGVRQVRPCSPLGYPSWVAPTLPQFTVTAIVTIGQDTCPANIKEIVNHVATEANVPANRVSVTCASGSAVLTIKIKNENANSAERRCDVHPPDRACDHHHRRNFPRPGHHGRRGRVGI